MYLPFEDHWLNKCFVALLQPSTFLSQNLFLGDAGFEIALKTTHFKDTPICLFDFTWFLDTFASLD